MSSMLVLLVLTSPGWEDGLSTKAALAGTVNGSQGRPLVGATVIVWTAHPKKGVGHL